ncbi:MAG: D-alanyl-D-alanine carboxypeptidase [Deltaproteobacteria bacterium]|nr:D-alanyl-D-alanine carboxypeptidase [Deltaproteobacteria bacterium]
MHRFVVPFIFIFLLILPVGSYAPVLNGAEKGPPRKTGVKVMPGTKPSKERPAAKATPVETSPPPKGVGIEASPGHIDARSAMIVETHTGSTLLEYNADETIEPASFTKVLTLYLVFEALREGRVRLSDELWISEAAWRTGGSKMFVGMGTKVPLEELIKGITVVSGNDACVAVAEHLNGSVESFVNAMNVKAKELGMTRSHFMNPHGLPAEGQVTTARDMAKLGSSYLRSFPEAIRYHSIREYTYNNITQYNRNHLLLKDPSVDGLKTGFVGAAGYHLSATAQREGMRLLAVVMGAATPGAREREALKLLNFGFRNYAFVQPFPEGQPVGAIRVWKGEKDAVNLYPQELPGFPIAQTQRNTLKWEVRTLGEITAPVSQNQPLGELVFLVSDVSQKSIPLVSREEIPLGGVFKRMWHSVRQIHKLDWRWVAALLGFLGTIALVGLLVSNRQSLFKRSRSPYGR